MTPQDRTHWLTAEPAGDVLLDGQARPVTQVWQEMRARFAYPRAYVSLHLDGAPAVPAGEAQEIAPGAWVRFHDGQVVLEQPTDAAHHQHFYSQLSSADNLTAFIGVGAVVYWGFLGAAYNTNRARSRFRWFFDGNRRAAGNQMQNVCQALNRSREAIGQGDYSGALRAISTLMWLGQVSFASKAIMFLDPIGATVFDKRIAVIARETECLNAFAMNANGGGVTGPKAQTYAAWCTWCADRAARLNDSGSTWADADGTPRQWRAVDIERAVYTSGEPP